MKTIKARVVALIMAAVVIAGGFGSMKAQAIDLGDIIKVGGIGYLVKQFGPDINKAINAAYGNSKIAPYEYTKVVPIISFGEGGYIGAAQVQGAKVNVEKVQAVAQLEVKFFNKAFRVKALVPVDNINPTDMSRVKGTGVSAQIDVKI